MSDAADPAAYIAAVLTLYVDLPDTPLRASVSDQWLARRFQGDGVPLHVVESALLLGSLRRLIRPAGSPRLSPWPTSARSLRNSRRIPCPMDISITFASSSAKPPQPCRHMPKNLRFLVTVNI